MARLRCRWPSIKPRRGHAPHPGHLRRWPQPKLARTLTLLIISPTPTMTPLWIPDVTF